MEDRNRDKGGNEKNESSSEAPRVDSPGLGSSPFLKVGRSISMHPNSSRSSGHSNLSLLLAGVLLETQRPVCMMMESEIIVLPRYRYVKTQVLSYAIIFGYQPKRLKDRYNNRIVQPFQRKALGFNGSGTTW